MQPLVSVRVATYNHEKYIIQCLEGILMQRTQFPFEVIIGEDCSTDRTREIVKEYQKKHPEIIRVITSEQNVGSMQNNLRIQAACRGQYHAYCEGDDYWIDPLKLQKQVNFMETHPDYVMCFHNVLVLSEDKSEPASFICPPDLPRKITVIDLLQRQMFIQTGSVLVRNPMLAVLPEWRSKVWCGDLVQRLWCTQQGPVGYLDELMSVYRKHSGGLTTTIYSDINRACNDAIYIYEQFNQYTDYQYNDLILKNVKMKKRSIVFRKLKRSAPILCFFVSPNRIIKKIFKECFKLLNVYNWQ
jgi:glycosyltransferase involved in cell wall biosynthesis